MMVRSARERAWRAPHYYAQNSGPERRRDRVLDEVAVRFEAIRRGRLSSLHCSSAPRAPAPRKSPCAPQVEVCDSCAEKQDYAKRKAASLKSKKKPVMKSMKKRCEKNAVLSPVREVAESLA